MTDMTFQYHDEGETPPCGLAYIARVPTSISAKDVLLRTLSQVLGFPEYFGVNWDGLDECLSDLSWIEVDDVCLWHDDLPLVNAPEEANAYLRVLRHVLDEPGRKALRITFPKSAKATIDSILSSSVHR